MLCGLYVLLCLCVAVLVFVYVCVIEKSNSLLDCCSSCRNWFNLAYEWFNIELWLLISAFAFTFSTFRNRFTYARRLTTGLIQYAKLSYCHYGSSFRPLLIPSLSLSLFPSLRLRLPLLLFLATLCATSKLQNVQVKMEPVAAVGRFGSTRFRFAALCQEK